MKRQKNEEIDKVIETLRNSFTDEKVKKIILDQAFGRKVDYEDESEIIKTLFQNISRDDLIREFAKQALKVASAKNLQIISRETSDGFYELIKEEKIPYDGLLNFVKGDKSLIYKLAIAYLNQRIMTNIDYTLLDKITDSEIRKYSYYLEETNLPNNKTSIAGKVKNLTLNKSMHDVISTGAISKDYSTYSLGRNIYAVRGKAPKKSIQDEAVLLLEHPDNKNFKLLAIADGNRNYYGDIMGSNYTLSKLAKWFQSLSKELFNDPVILQELLQNKLRQINVELMDSNLNNKTSLSCIITGSDKTLISSIGDARVYKEKDGNFEKVTRDDSYVQEIVDLGYVQEKDARFHIASDILNKYLGMTEYFGPLEIEMKVIDNDYDKLIIVSNGITRTLDEGEIRNISAQEQAKTIAKGLVEKALTTKSEFEGIPYGYKQTIEEGKENSTALVYVKRKKLL